MDFFFLVRKESAAEMVSIVGRLATSASEILEHLLAM